MTKHCFTLFITLLTACVFGPNIQATKFFYKVTIDQKTDTIHFDNLNELTVVHCEYGDHYSNVLAVYLISRHNTYFINLHCKKTGELCRSIPVMEETKEHLGETLTIFKQYAACKSALDNCIAQLEADKANTKTLHRHTA